jgi:hypothetical protein
MVLWVMSVMGLLVVASAVAALAGRNETQTQVIGTSVGAGDGKLDVMADVLVGLSDLAAGPAREGR